MDRKKTVDAVAMTRRIRDNHYEELKGKSHAERIAFYREKSRQLRERFRVQHSESEE